jgi:hypothetical protein
MPQVVDSLTSVVEQLSERLRELESRVALVEAHTIAGANAAVLSTRKVSPSEASPDSQGSRSAERTVPRIARPDPGSYRFADLERSATVFSTIGKAALGFAGAFLLRAVAESGSIPKLPILIVAILYPCFWMIWSTRSKTRFASVIYALTSTLILSPMLWEATVRFQSIPAGVSAAVLVGFVTLAIALSLRRELQVVPWIATLGAVSTCIALIMGTHDLVPLAAALLAIALATEWSVCLGHDLTFRLIPALVADFAVSLVIYILGSGSVPEGYRAASATTLILLYALLPAIYGAGVCVRTFMQLRRMTLIDIGQGVVSCALGAFGILTTADKAAAGPMGAIFLLAGLVCYWGMLSRFAATSLSRNRHVSATWAAALLLAASFLLLAPDLRIPFLCAAALLAGGSYTRTAKLSLGLHASFYLAAATIISPLASYVWSALAGNVPGGPDWRIWFVTLSAALCYAVESLYSVDNGRRRLLWVVPAGVVAFTLAAWAVTAIVRLATEHVQLAAPHLSMVRIVVLCTLALVLGVASRRRHIELRWTAYAAVGLGTLKLVLEDLRFGNAISLVVSFVFYGLILILLPRLTPMQTEEAGARDH